MKSAMQYLLMFFVLLTIFSSPSCLADGGEMDLATKNYKPITIKVPSNGNDDFPFHGLFDDAKKMSQDSETRDMIHKILLAPIMILLSLVPLLLNPFTIIILIFVFAKRQSRKNFSHQETSSKSPLTYTKDKDLEKLVSRDPHFSKEDFLDMATKNFLIFKESLMEKNLEKLQKIETKELFQKHKEQIFLMKERKQSQKIDDLSILSKQIESYEEDEYHQILSCIFISRSKRYFVDEETGDILRGDPNKFYMMTDRLTFVRMIEAKTRKDPLKESLYCPNCGASIATNQGNICEYCGSKIELSTSQWLLSNHQILQFTDLS